MSGCRSRDFPASGISNKSPGVKVSSGVNPFPIFSCRTPSESPNSKTAYIPLDSLSPLSQLPSLWATHHPGIPIPQNRWYDLVLGAGLVLSLAKNPRLDNNHRPKGPVGLPATLSIHDRPALFWTESKWFPPPN